MWVLMRTRGLQSDGYSESPTLRKTWHHDILIPDIFGRSG